MSRGTRELAKLFAVGGSLALAAASASPALAAGSPEGREAPWARHIRAVDVALATGDVGAAERALHQAHLAVLPSRTWEGLVEVGDAYRRAGESLRTPRQAQAKAREYYLAALFRARQQRSLPGVFRTAEGFAAMGDREPVSICLRVAESLAARLVDPLERDQALASVERLAQRLLAMDGLKGE